MNLARKQESGIICVHILNHVTQMASEDEVVWFRDRLLLNIGVMSISVIRILSRGKCSLFVLDIL